MELDEATKALLAQLAQVSDMPLQEMPLQQSRGLGEMLRTFVGPGPEVLRVEDLTLPTGLRIRVLTPRPDPRAILVYFHGGGWVLNSIDDFDKLGRTLAERTGCTVVLVDYRLAPEHPYPAALDDAWSSVCWIDAHRAELAVAGAPLIVAGDSAGGNLATVTARKARDAGAPKVDLQILLYPVTDSVTDGPGYHEPENQTLMLSRDLMAWYWDMYVSDPADRVHPDVAPLRTPNLSGMPPTVILTASNDILRAEGESYAARLREAGVDTEIERFDGQMHAFVNFIGILPGATAAIDYLTAVIERHLGKP